MLNRSDKRHWAFIAIATVIIAVSASYLVFFRNNYLPIHRLDQDKSPFFSDDFDIDSLISSASHQIDYLKRQDQKKSISFGKDHYSYAWLLTSVRALIRECQRHPDATALNRFLKKNYTVYQAGGRKGQRNRKMLVTGYYEPVFAGSLVKTPPYLTAVYSRPDSLIVLPGKNNAQRKIGRYDKNNSLIPYWTRTEIETSNILKGYELAYLKDPFDAYLLHVQGSGRIRLPDNTIKTIRFSASNGLKYKSIGKWLVDEKIMSLADVNIPAIRAYLQRHPEQEQHILRQNPRYIFFTWGDDSGPKGSSGEILTPGRSIAMDTTSLPDGAIAYLVSRRPVVSPGGTITDWIPLHRLVFPQDSGAAIQGTGRVDVFWGLGNYAETAANHMKEKGKLYFLVKKGYPGTTP